MKIYVFSNWETRKEILIHSFLHRLISLFNVFKTSRIYIISKNDDLKENIYVFLYMCGLSLTPCDIYIHNEFEWGIIFKEKCCLKEAVGFYVNFSQTGERGGLSLFSYCLCRIPVTFLMHKHTFIYDTCRYANSVMFYMSALFLSYKKEPRDKMHSTQSL